MADQRISDLTAATSLADADIFPIVQEGDTKKVTGATLKAYAQQGLQAGVFPFYKADGSSDPINLTVDSRLPFYTSGGTASNIPLTV